MNILQSQTSKNSIQSKKSAKSLKNQNIILNQFKNKKQIILHLTKQFDINFNQNNKDIYSCIHQFLNQLKLIMKININYDNSISDILCSLSYQKQFLQFDNSIQNPLKKTLQIINQCLRQKNFISQRQCNKFKDMFLYQNLQESIYKLKQQLQDSGYIRRKNKGQIQPLKMINKQNCRQKIYLQELTSLWKNSMKGVTMQNFWSFILDRKIEFKQFLPIYKVYQYVIKYQISQQFRSQINNYLKLYVQKIRQQQKLKIQPLRKIQTSLIQYNLMLQHKAQHISSYLHKQRWAKYTQQYESVTKYLSQRCTKSIKFQSYGSFKNKFYVINFSDIDIGLFYQGKQLDSRINICNLLWKIKSILDQDKQYIPNYNYCKAFTFDKIVVPFLKIQFKTNYGKNKDIVPSMDIIINKSHGLQNSILLGMYAQDEYILKFCNLIKYWAAKRDLINMKQKFQGLSSYGVLLMGLFYLMSSRQIPFLKFNKQDKKKYQIGKQKFKIKQNYLQNFIGFLKFYSLSYKDKQSGKYLTGQFHMKYSEYNQNNRYQIKGNSKIVCLLQPNYHYQFSRKVYNKDFIINMYDFIDDTNPGRMRTYLTDKFTLIFSETLECLQQQSLSFLQIVYGQEQVNNTWFKQKNKEKDEIMMPKRGNRI